MDAEPKSAEWWEEQCARYKAEVVEVTKHRDELNAEVVALQWSHDELEKANATIGEQADALERSSAELDRVTSFVVDLRAASAKQRTRIETLEAALQRVVGMVGPIFTQATNALTIE